MSKYTRLECARHGPFLATLETDPPPLVSALCPACHTEANEPSLEGRDFFADFKHNVQDEITTFLEGTEPRDWLWFSAGILIAWLWF